MKKTRERRRRDNRGKESRGKRRTRRWRGGKVEER